MDRFFLMPLEEPPARGLESLAASGAAGSQQGAASERRRRQRRRACSESTAQKSI